MTPPSRSAAPRSPDAPPRLLFIVLAFAAVYLIWGSTYLAIRWAIETMPPLLMAGVRFLVAGAALYGWSRMSGRARPSLPQWRSAAICGALLLVGGNGAVVLAEQWVPSGLAALIVGTVPLWMVLLDARFGSRNRPTPRALGGLAIGFGGVALLAGSPGVGGGGGGEIVGVLLLLFASLSWASGSIFARYTKQAAPQEQWVGMQMLCGGAILLMLSFVFGEPFGFDTTAVSARSVWSLVYLIVFGAVVGYGAYIWLLSVVTPAQAATYAYVNPVVALALGWGLAGESLTPRSVVAAVIIVGAVAVISRERPGR